MPGLLKILMAAALCLVLALPAAAGKAGDAPRATSMSLSQQGDATRFTAEMSFAVGYNVYVLADPFRVIIDLPEIDFESVTNSQAQTLGLIRDFRFGIMEKGRSRIVIDVAQPVLIDRSFIERRTEQDPAKLVVDVIPTSRETFDRLKIAEQPGPPPAPVALSEETTMQDLEAKPVAPAASQMEQAKSEISAAIAAMKQTAVVPVPRPKPGISEEPARPARNKRVVVIDPGHGGIDPGAISRRGTKEKAIVLDFAKRLRALLLRKGKYEVILTRSNDTFISLRDRVKIARKANADLFIAVHADSVRSRRARGATIYTVSEKASDREAAELARQENRSDIIAGVDLDEENDEITGILIDLAQRETNNHSLFFAKKMLQQIKRVTKMNARPLRSAGFRVLKAPDVPSVLFELGYLSSRADERLLKSRKWQQKSAVALAASIDRYFSTRLAGRQ